MRYRLGRHTGSTIDKGDFDKIIFDLPVNVDSSFAEVLSTRVVEQTVNVWEFWFGLLVAYTEEQDLARPPSSFKTTDGYSLGTWVSYTRNHKGTLSAEQITRLESLPGWVWDVLDTQWEESFGCLEAFINQEGHARPPHSFKAANGYSLGSWASHQRTRNMKGMLSAEQITRLESLPGWVWDVLDTQWEEGFGYLKTFVKQEGHAKPPQSFKTTDGYSLRAWVNSQRTRKKKDTLSLERITRLESLPGWVWDVLDTQWEEGFGYLKTFVKQEGHARPAARFKTADGYLLGSWVNRLRSYKETLSVEQIARLESLRGWVWDAHKARWEEGFDHLDAFVNQEGHAKPPVNFKATDGYSLGGWARNQRTKKDRLSAEQITRLESLPGWVWDLRNTQWEEGFGYLEAFVKQEGHAKPPQSFKTTDGSSLGVWVNNQRRRKGTLSTEQIARLESLSGWAWDARRK